MKLRYKRVERMLSNAILEHTYNWDADFDLAVDDALFEFFIYLSEHGALS